MGRPELLYASVKSRSRILSPCVSAKEKTMPTLWASRHPIQKPVPPAYITPKDMLAGRQQEIHADRDRKLEAARQQRQIRRQSAA